MTGRTLGILALIALVAIGAALLVQRTRAAPTAAPATASDGVLLPGLMDAMEKVASVRIVDAEGAIQLTKNADGIWQDATHAGYPAKAQAIGQLVLSLASQDSGEPKTDDPVLFAEIGLEDPAPGPNGTVIELKDGAGGAIATVILGKPSERVMGGRFVRVLGADRARQIIMNMSPSSTIREWVDPQVVRIPRDRIASITVQPIDAPPVAVERQGADSPTFVVRGFEGGLSTDPLGPASQLTSSLAWIDFEDVRTAAGDPPTDSLVTTTYRMRDGWSLEIESWAEGDLRWMRARVIDPSTPAEGEAGVRLAAELAAMHTIVTGWDFRIPPSRYDTFRPTLEAMTAPAPPPPSAPAQSPAPQ